MLNIITKTTNFLYWAMSLILIFVVITNFYTVYANASGMQQSGNTQIGARITSVSAAGCQLPPPSGSGPDAVCVAAGCPPNTSTNGVLMTPFGYSATGFCPLIAMNTTKGPISVANVGYVILGLFQGSVIGMPAVPFGMPAMELQS